VVSPHSREAAAIKRMAFRNPWTRVRNYYRRKIGRVLFRKPFRIQTPRPLISFTFDDFPRSAFLTGGAILSRYGLAGTYYTSLGLAGEDGPSGPLYQLEDLKELLEQGHELGCHTYSHCNSWETDAETFEISVRRNREALDKLLPGAEFQSHSYPIAEPRPATKRRVARHFLCCRGGGQVSNIGTTDLNQLSAYFLEKSRDRIQDVQEIIEHNHEARGWLIFGTHDVSPDPSPYGCSPEFFESVVRYALNSGARILPVVATLQAIRRTPPATAVTAMNVESGQAQSA
jgi:peptidoglycan/xylan/chitin deacetylase (PgdA/CDA1 family)